MKRYYFAACVKDDEGLYALVVPATELDNLSDHFRRWCGRDPQTVKICPTKKAAEVLVRGWNAVFIRNGTHAHVGPGKPF